MRRVLAAIVVPLAIATLIGMAVLWPGRSSLIGSQPFAAQGASLATAEVTSLDVGDCAAAASSLVTGSDATTEASLLKDAVCARITSGQGEGLILPVHVPSESFPAADVGDRLRVMYTPDALASGTPYVFVDYDRHVPVVALGIVYLVLVLAVAGRRGLRAVAGLLLATGVLAGFVLPALLALAPPMWVTLVGASAMVLLAVYTAHGISVRTTTALLGTLVGVVVTVLLALWGVDAANLTGGVGEDALTLSSLVKGLDLRALLTCGMVIAGLGVLNDVTITQASAVWELHAANPALGRRRLLAGRDEDRPGPHHVDRLHAGLRPRGHGAAAHPRRLAHRPSRGGHGPVGGDRGGARAHPRLLHRARPRGAGDDGDRRAPRQRGVAGGSVPVVGEPVRIPQVSVTEAPLEAAKSHCSFVGTWSEKPWSSATAIAAAAE